MPRQIHRLDAMTVKHLKARGLHADGGGLYLQISRFDTKSWIFRFTLNGNARQMGLGPLHTVPLSEARQAAEECRKLLRTGTDPIDHRKTERARHGLEVAKVMTFKECATAYLRSHGAVWSNIKHSAQWKSTLEAYVYPSFGTLPVQDIDTGLVLKVLEPIWATKTETASRIRGRIESILDWAKARGYREGENPARWRGHLDKLLPAKSKISKVTHHAALPYTEIGAFVSELQNHDAVSARGLEFLILTAARTGEVINATWGEIDFAHKVWTIPEERMKAGNEHRVPLSERTIKILNEMQEAKVSDFIFPGAKKNRPLSNMAFLQLMKRMGRDDLTAHGFRSTFRDWTAERTNYPGEVAEMALAHTVSDKVEAAYRRGDMFDKRRRLMDEWAIFCRNPSMDSHGKVTPIRETLK